MELRNYQLQLFNECFESFKKGNKKIIACLPTGAGKTVIFSYLCKKHLEKNLFAKVLILTHRKELLKQGGGTIESFGINPSYIQSNKKYINFDNNVFIAMVETLNRRDIPFEPTLIIVDECFVAGTKIDNKNIEDLKIGDYVKSFNHTTGKIEKKRILNTSKNIIKCDLLKINYLNDSFVCTHKHPIFVKGKGYVPADELEINDIIYGRKIKLLELWERTFFKRLPIKYVAFSIKQNKKKWNNILYKIMRGVLLFSNALNENERKKPNDGKGNEKENVEHIKEDRAQTKNTRWEWSWNDRAAKNVIKGTWEWMVSRISNSYRRRLQAISLQNRYSKSYFKNCNRNRWRFSSFFNSKKEGCKEGYFLKEQRIQSIEIFKSGNYTEYNGCENENFVFNLEVDGNNNYFANGILVHNCHIGNFKKVLNKYKDIYTIGFTATPISATLKDPLKNYYTDIVIGKQIHSLIAEGFLCEPKQFAMQEIDVKKLTKKGGEFTEESQFKLFGEKKMFDGVLSAYASKTLNKKTLIFCCNIEHSNLTAAHFTANGFDAKSLTSKDSDSYRDDVLKWFKSTDNAILVNCGILTTGFDEPSIECIILNRATTSITLMLQMCGRGGRIYNDKKYFTILDFGTNIMRLGGWSDERRWKDIFFADPKKKKKVESIPDLKKCPECFALIKKAALTCPECNHEFEREKKPNSSGELVEYKYTSSLDLSGKMLSELNIFELLYIYNNRILKPSYVLRVVRNKNLLEEFAKLKGFKKGWTFYQSTQPKDFINKKITL